ncbi:Coiled-coil domain-containing protein 87 [Irineochytrium annulatum]|nr:Coiled-coil domain-containing protein 87 [Irineochytrium annulatum]
MYLYLIPNSHEADVNASNEGASGSPDGKAPEGPYPPGEGVDQSGEQKEGVVEKKKPPLKKVRSTIDIADAQSQLEQIWVALKMPVDQKLDMAIKYGSPKFGPKLETAIKLWATAREYIGDREKLLVDVAKFEETASDPDRFFKKGSEGSSVARLQEARSREELLEKLHYFEARISDIVSLIKYQLNETVTYQGAFAMLLL